MKRYSKIINTLVPTRDFQNMYLENLMLGMTKWASSPLSTTSS